MMRFVFRASTLLALGALALPLRALQSHAQGSSKGMVPQPLAASPLPFIKGFSATSDVTMRIYAPAGRVRVVVWQRDSVMVRGTMGPKSSFFGGGARTHIKLGVESRVASDTVLPSVDWEVTVPRNARLWIKMIDGALLASGTAGELEMYTVRGSIEVRDVSGVTSIESIDAPVVVQRASGDVRVRGSKGKVMLTDVRGTMSVATVSGPVMLTRIATEGRVETIGGNVFVSEASLGGAALEIQTHSGGISLSLDADRAPKLDLSSRAGPVQGDKYAGNPKFGQIIARSFKGIIQLRSLYVTP